jgi:CRISPR-associated exonuclease Cas4
MYSEEVLIPISALQHFAFCPRQCALIHIEQAWEDNRLTAEGRIMHERVHEGGSETRPRVHIAHGLRLRSLRLGLAGMADIVEFLPDHGGTEVPGLSGRWRPHPVEYKRGRPKPDRCDEIQLCGQALCLEEMLNVAVVEGDIFYGQPRRRHAVAIDAELRRETESVTMLTHEFLHVGITPPSEFGSRCRSCSLYDQCQPKTAGARKSARRYIGQMLTP